MVKNELSKDMLIDLRNALSELGIDEAHEKEFTVEEMNLLRNIISNYDSDGLQERGLSQEDSITLERISSSYDSDNDSKRKLSKQDIEKLKKIAAAQPAMPSDRPFSENDANALRNIAVNNTKKR